MNFTNRAVLVFALAASATAGTEKASFYGEISDTQCAMNVHSLSRSHEEMIVKNTMGTDPTSCARACVRRGGEWVLRSGENVYRLKNQNGIDVLAGHKVKVLGTLDAKTMTIDNIAIETTSSGK